MLITSLLFMALISFVIAEFFGRSKHIGRWWTFTLSISGFLVVGIVAALLSPSAKQKPTKGKIGHRITGIIFLIHGMFTFMMFSLQVNYVGISQAISFIILGLYLIVLSSDKIVNNNPKFYFNLSNAKSILKDSITSKINTSSSQPDFIYFIRVGDTNSDPMNFAELKSLKINGKTPIWRKGLDEWVFAKDLKELESIIIQEPPIFKEPIEIDKKPKIKKEKNRRSLDEWITHILTWMYK